MVEEASGLRGGKNRQRVGGMLLRLLQLSRPFFQRLLLQRQVTRIKLMLSARHSGMSELPDADTARHQQEDAEQLPVRPGPAPAFRGLPTLPTPPAFALVILHGRFRSFGSSIGAGCDSEGALRSAMVDAPPGGVRQVDSREPSRHLRPARDFSGRFGSPAIPSDERLRGRLEGQPHGIQGGSTHAVSSAQIRSARTTPSRACSALRNGSRASTTSSSSAAAATVSPLPIISPPTTASPMSPSSNRATRQRRHRAQHAIIRSNYLTPKGPAFTRPASNCVRTCRGCSTSTSSIRSAATYPGPLAASPATQRWRAGGQQDTWASTANGRPDFIQKCCPSGPHCGGHQPAVVGALYHPPGAIARHDAVAWAYARAADRSGVEIHQRDPRHQH